MTQPKNTPVSFADDSARTVILSRRAALGLLGGAGAAVALGTLLDRSVVLAADNGIATCYDAKAGKRLWMERLGRRHSASAVVAGGNAYFPDDDGITWVVQPGPEFKLLAKNELNEPVSASPAISQGNLFIRTDGHLHCIGPQPAIGE